MATVNLGAIKFNWKGAYNSGTAYVIDDVVSSGGTSYICVASSIGNAVSDTSYWAVMAQAGTDLTSTLTTQGDVLYRDGSGLQRLAKGTAGQALKMNSGATAPEWGTDQGGAWNIISTTTASSSSAIDITSGLTSTYSEYAFVLSDFICSTAMAVYMRITIDGGSSYPTSNYQWRNHYLKHDVTSYKSENGAGSNNFHLFDEYDITHFSTILYVSNPSQTTHNKHLRWNSVGYTSSNQTLGIDGCGHYVGATNAINGFKFYPNTGNFTSGRVTLYGIAHA
jgi:hypothetical protein